MKFTAASVVTMAALVTAQTISDIPSCALPCLTASVKKETSCSETDFACICKPDNFSKVQGDTTSCVISACGGEVGDVLSAVSKVCGAASSGGVSTTSLIPSTTSKHPNAPTITTTSAPTTPTTNGTSPHTVVVVAGAPALPTVGGLAILALAAAFAL